MNYILGRHLGFCFAKKFQDFISVGLRGARRTLLLTILALFSYCTALGREEEKESATQTTFPVRVLLDQTEENSSFSWTLSSAKGFKIEDVNNATTVEDIKDCKIIITLKKGKIAINGRRLSVRQARIIAQEGYIKYNDLEYAGDMLITWHEKMIYLINSVDLEDYIFSVVRWEGWPGWPLEVNKVFAIMCRTYVVNKVLIERRKKKIFDIKNSNIHQTYKGIHAADHLRQALAETRGVVMTYKGVPIEAMYDASCGGVVPALLDGVNFNGAPYLKRTYACPYCKKTKVYSWQVEYTRSSLEEILKNYLELPISIIDISVSKRDKAGVVQELLMRAKSGTYVLPAKKVYALFKYVKSLCFDVVKKGKRFIFKGRGYGHHLGICQWGVRQMVKEGWTYLEILNFYYLGISFMNIQVVEGA